MTAGAGRARPVRVGLAAGRARAGLAAGLVLLGGASGCTDDGTGPSAGAWEATVTGTVNRSLIGLATFGSVASDDGDDDFLIELLADGAQPVVRITVRSAAPGPLPVGNHPVQPVATTQAVAVEFLQLEGGGLTGSLQGQSGSVTIRTSTDGRVGGDFDFTATGFLIVSGTAVADAEIEVSGSFSAVSGD